MTEAEADSGFVHVDVTDAVLAEEPVVEVKEEIKVEPVAAPIEEQVKEVIAEVKAHVAEALANAFVSTDDVRVDAVVSVSPPIKLVSLEQACHTLIFDFKTGWLPAIKIRAGVMGRDVSRLYTLAEWREVFIAWGGHGMLK
jgi:hypothetical protein